MEEPLNQAYEAYALGTDHWEEARDLVNVAYFDFYEKEGFERMVMASISGKRAKTVEYKFATIKTGLKDGKDLATIRADIDTLIGWLKEDGLALDVKFGIVAQAPSAQETAAADGGASQGALEPAAQGEGTEIQASSPPAKESLNWASFFLSLGILLREGFEAILVIAAIAAYLRRAGYQNQIKVVYWSAIGAVLASFAAAIGLQYIFSVTMQNQEILEGITMLLATVVLFGVSNWMFSKAEAEAWKNYIQGKVEMAVTKGSSFALGAAAFLAVFREGAETILFYQPLFSQAGTDSTMIWAGIIVGAVGLAVIFIFVRLGTMIIPLKPFFIGTSILMFIMSIAFAGGGVAELQEADVIGASPVPFYVPTITILGIFPYWQTLVPQFVILLLAVGSILWIKFGGKDKGTPLLKETEN
jgi:high-affinity iron transporter